MYSLVLLIHSSRLLVADKMKNDTEPVTAAYDILRVECCSEHTQRIKFQTFKRYIATPPDFGYLAWAKQKCISKRCDREQLHDSNSKYHGLTFYIFVRFAFYRSSMWIVNNFVIVAVVVAFLNERAEENVFHSNKCFKLRPK